ncbi:ACR2.1 [Symbiodinium natans]|uniref:ACR2.1 protein n=1 Tax=Symbiodinium natans TaxID=878477 RepID=A0A812IBI9_9DINO|nr:ACR2.1 [Symbiodinium natans]
MSSYVDLEVPDLVRKYQADTLVFHCLYSLHRGPQCANWYRKQADLKQRVAVMDGGFRGWEQCHLPVIREGHVDLQKQAGYNMYGLSVGRRMAGAGA